MAAVLVGGSSAVLSHESAAALWGVRATRSGRIHVTAPRFRRSRASLALHRSHLPDDEVSAVGGIPATTVARTLLDLAAFLAHREVERALAQAEVLRLYEKLSLPDLLERYPGRRGAAIAREAIAAVSLGSTLTRSELEERFLGFLDRFGFARPAVNADLAVASRWFVADFAWRRARLIVELDGYAFHSTAAAFERDRARDRALSVDGWRVVRVTWRQLHDEPEALAIDLRRLLAAGVGAATAPE